MGHGLRACGEVGGQLERFGGRVPAAPVNDLRQALDNPFLREREAIQDLEHPAAGAFRMLATPIRVEGSETRVRPAPELGADTTDVLVELGYGPDDIERLRSGGIIR